MSTLSLTLRIDWSEIDLMGHINNLAIQKYIQSSRIHYFEQVGIASHHQDEPFAPILASVEVRYVKPLFYPGSVTVRSSVEQIQTTSILMRHEVYDEQQDLVASAKDVLVYYDYSAQKKHPLPDCYRQAIGKIEGKDFSLAK